jgi:hypothetical protein
MPTTPVTPMSAASGIDFFMNPPDSRFYQKSAFFTYRRAARLSPPRRAPRLISAVSMESETLGFPSRVRARFGLILLGYGMYRIENPNDRFLDIIQNLCDGAVTFF